MQNPSQMLQKIAKVTPQTLTARVQTTVWWIQATPKLEMLRMKVLSGGVTRATTSSRRSLSPLTWVWLALAPLPEVWLTPVPTTGFWLWRILSTWSQSVRMHAVLASASHSRS